MRGGDFSCHLVWQQQKIERWTGPQYKWPPLAKATQLPNENSTSIGAGIQNVIWPQQNVRGGQLPVILDGDWSNKK
jgi:hypothetical protein